MAYERAEVIRLKEHGLERTDECNTFRVGADADAQELVDAWLIEVPHENGPLTQFSGQLRAIVLPTAPRIAAIACGDGPYGFSLVLSLISPGICTCSPGV